MNFVEKKLNINGATCDDRGFSLTELIMVMAIISAMAVVAVPQLARQVPKWHVNGTSKDIAGKLMLARIRAIQENHAYGVEFTLGDVDVFRIVKNSANDGSGTWSVVGIQSEGANDIDVTLNCGTVVEFYGNGSADTSSGCANNATILTLTTLAGVSVTRTISLNTLTGKISVN